MRIILSPAKKMKTDGEGLAPWDSPVFLKETRQIHAWLLEHSFEEAKKLWGCNEKLARENYERFEDFGKTAKQTPAILAYDGIQYTYMAPSVFEGDQFDYVQAHLRILSGFYGVLKPMDAVSSYRLEMGTKLDRPLEGAKSLYAFWGEKLYREVRDESGVIINLASKEYSKAIEPYLQSGDDFLTCVFGERTGDKVVQKGVYAKMARGEMVRFMAVRGVTRKEELKDFQEEGYRFQEDLSTKKEYVFAREGDS